TLYNNNVPVVRYSFTQSGGYETICQNGATLAKDWEGAAAGVCSNWPATAQLIPVDQCSDPPGPSSSSSSSSPSGSSSSSPNSSSLAESSSSSSESSSSS